MRGCISFTSSFLSTSFLMNREEMESRSLREMQEERNRQDQESFREMEKYARCVLLPSPEEFDTPANPGGSDATGILEDFKNFLKWAEKLKLYNTGHLIDLNGEGIEEVRYNSMISFAFKTGYGALQNTNNLMLNELMFCYYAGHGLAKETAQNLYYSAVPVLKFRETFFKLSPQYVGTGERKVKGGELCLHKTGFCDFKGLIQPFIEVIKSQSTHRSGVKKNKHLVIVLDSCHSGQFAEDLKGFFSENQEWLNEGCSVTVQASCESGEKAVGGYFTPTFIFLNDPDNRNVLDDLKGKWGKMKEEEKNIFRSFNFPSPVMETTRNKLDNTSPTLEIKVQTFKMTLFRDAGFFKFCHCVILGPIEIAGIPNPGNERVLESNSAEEFLHGKNFTVMDFKLKTMTTEPFKDEKIGLFLLKDPSVQHHAICAHVHFAERGTSKVGRINLVHHNYLPKSLPLLDYKEDTIGLSKSQIKKGRYKISVAMISNCPKPNEKDPSHWKAWKWCPETANGETFSSLAQAVLAEVDHSKQFESIECAMELVTKCHGFVEAKCPGAWNDLSKWNAKLRDPSFLGKFREKERSSSMDLYLEKVKSYDLPTI